jgi:DNA-binding CsgD family transcriptional regulator
MMHMIHLGLSNSQIAKIRGTTIKSAENSIARLAKKLKIPNSSEVSQRVLIARKFSDLSEE